MVWGLTSRPPVSPCGLSSGFPVCPPGSPPSSAFLWFLRPAVSGLFPSAVARFRIPFGFPPGSLPPSNLYVSAAAGRFRGRWSRAAGTKVTSSAAIPSLGSRDRPALQMGSGWTRSDVATESPVTSGRERRTSPRPNRPDRLLLARAARTNPLRGPRALEETGSRIGTAPSRNAVIGLEQGRISRSWQPDATTGRGRPGPNPELRMFRLVQREWEETGMHLRYLQARHPAIAGGSVHYVQAVSSRVIPSPPVSPSGGTRGCCRYTFYYSSRDAKGPLPAGKGP